MMYEDVVADFAKRTKANLAAIDRLRNEGHEVFEATQLVNSTLGLLVFPQQSYVAKIPKIPLAKLERLGWPVPEVEPSFTQAADLRQLVRYLRNAIAHFNIEFEGDGTDHIRLLRVWNKDRNNIVTWEATLSVSDLRGIADKFVELLQDRSTW